MSYWGNNKFLDTKCPRCHVSHEDQLHVFLDCKFNSTYYDSAMSQIDNLIRENLKHPIQEAVNFWGLPYRMSNIGCDRVKDNEVSSEWRRNIYYSSLGYISIDMMKYFTKSFSVHKPLKVLRAISHILMDMSYSIWIARCTQHANRCDNHVK